MRIRSVLPLNPRIAFAVGALAMLAVALAVLVTVSVPAQAQTAPSVTGVAITSDAGSDRTYILGETVRVTVTFSEAVTVTGAPRLAIDMDPANWGRKWANYESGSGSAELTFAHTVVVPNYSTQGVAVVANTLELNGGTIRSASGADAGLSHTGLDHDANHKVDAGRTPEQPSITGVAITTDAGPDRTYPLGETVRLTLTFSEAVTVTGTPRLVIDMDPANWGRKWISYESGSGTNQLTFAYTVAFPNLSTQGLAVMADTLELNGGAIRSASGTDATLGHAGLAHDADHRVDSQLLPATNQAPIVHTNAANYARFTRTAIAPRGLLLTKPFHGIFSDPEGGALTYSVSVPDDHRTLIDLLGVPTPEQIEETTRSLDAFVRVWFQYDADGDWSAVDPPLPNPLVTTVTVTATDPEGLSTSVSGEYYVWWDIPDTPTGLAAATEKGKLELTASWNDPGGAETYRLRWRTSGGEFADDNELLTYDTSAQITVADYGDWELQVEACIEAGCSEPASHTVTVAPACDLNAASSVSGLGIAKAAVISWTLPRNQSGACEVTGFTVGAFSSSARVEVPVTNPRARRHVLRDLEPGEYRFSVRTEYAQGASDDLVTGQQSEVPATCEITLSVQPYSGDAISGDWTNVSGTPTGCVDGPTVEFHVKRSADDYFKAYGQFPNNPLSADDLPDFIFYRFDPYVSYDFKVVAVDAAGDKHESNVATTTILSDDPSVTADDNSPGNLRVHADNHSGLLVTWDEPTVASGRTLSAYVVEWKTGDDAAATKVIAKDGDTEAAFQVRRHRITGLTDGNSYTVRVAARTHPDGDDTTTSDAWSVPAPRVRVWSEATQLWFIDDTPSFNIGATTDRVFMDSDANKNFASIHCSISTDGGAFEDINCPPGTLVNLTTSGTAIAARINWVSGDETFRSDPSVGQKGGPNGGFKVFASGGHGRIHVGWSRASLGSAIGNINAYIVQRRKQNADKSWPAWSDTGNATKGSHQLRHTYTGLTNGTWQVRVRARTTGDDGDPDTPDTPRLGFTSDVITVTLSLDYGVPQEPTRINVTPGDSQSLIVTWEPPHGDVSAAHSYQVRHRLREPGEEYTTSSLLSPRQTLRICGASGACENPRTHTITGLTAGKEYDVEVRAISVTGTGQWIRTHTHNIPND